MDTTISTDTSADISKLIHRYISQCICPKFFEYYKKEIIKIGAENYKLNGGTSYAFLYKGEEFNYYGVSSTNLEVLHDSLNNKIDELYYLKKEADNRIKRITQFFLYCMGHFNVLSFTSLSAYIPKKYHGYSENDNIFIEAASQDKVFKKMWEKVELDLNYLLSLNLIL